MASNNRDNLNMDRVHELLFEDSDIESDNEAVQEVNHENDYNSGSEEEDHEILLPLPQPIQEIAPHPIPSKPMGPRRQLETHNLFGNQGQPIDSPPSYHDLQPAQPYFSPDQDFDNPDSPTHHHH